MVVAIIQARMGSTRFPGKVLKPLLGSPILSHVTTRVAQSKRIDKVVVATSIHASDDVIEAFCKKNRIEIFRGSESDVLDRFYQAAKKYKATMVVRITADCPLIDPGLIDNIIDACDLTVSDYASNVNPPTYPDGLDIEVFSFDALERAWKETSKPSEREHVTTYLRYSNRFQTHNVQSGLPESARKVRWTIDYPEDLAYVEKILARGKGKHWIQILELIDSDPKLQQKPIAVTGEGYFKTLYAQASPKPIKGPKISFTAPAEKTPHLATRLQDGINTLAKEAHLKIKAVASESTVKLQCTDKKLQLKVLKGLKERNVHTTSTMNLNNHDANQVETTLESFASVFKQVA